MEQSTLLKHTIQIVHLPKINYYGQHNDLIALRKSTMRFMCIFASP